MSTERIATLLRWRGEVGYRQNLTAFAYLLVVEERAGLDVCGLILAVVVWDAGKNDNKIYVRLSTRSEN